MVYINWKNQRKPSLIKDYHQWVRIPPEFNGKCKDILSYKLHSISDNHGNFEWIGYRFKLKIDVLYPFWSSIDLINRYK